MPDDGFAPILDLVRKARTSIDATVFRFDRPEIEMALREAVARGVRVRALIAHTNRGGEKNLRKLETRLLEAGVTVARTADDLLRYHGKILIVDNTHVAVMLFNYTKLDAASRSFAVLTRKRDVVGNAARLFEADMMRQRFVQPRNGPLVVSPGNARPLLAGFLRKATRELFIYDPKVSDPAMLRILEERVSKGVDVRLIGTVGRRARLLEPARFAGARLHARVIIRDGEAAFLGSQSLRTVELDARREVGLFVRDRGVVRGLRDVFEQDWSLTDRAKSADVQKEEEAVAVAG